jgi:hypothetical protein
MWVKLLPIVTAIELKYWERDRLKCSSISINLFVGNDPTNLMSFNSDREPIDPFKLIGESISQVAPTYLSLFLINIPGIFVSLTPQLVPIMTSLSISYTYAILIAPIIGAISMCFLHRYLQNQTIDLGGAASQALGRIGTIIPTSIVIFIGIILASLLLLIPGIYLSVVWAFAIYAVVLENCSVFESLKYSKSLVKGRWWPVFGSMFAGVLIILPGVIISTAIAPKPNTYGTSGAIVSAAIGALIIALSTPILQMYSVKLYVRLRETANLIPVDKEL